MSWAPSPRRSGCPTTPLSDVRRRRRRALVENHPIRFGVLGPFSFIAWFGAMVSTFAVVRHNYRHARQSRPAPTCPMGRVRRFGGRGADHRVDADGRARAAPRPHRTMIGAGVRGLVGGVSLMCGVCHRQASRLRGSRHRSAGCAIRARAPRAAGAGRGSGGGTPLYRPQQPGPDHRSARDREHHLSVLDRGDRVDEVFRPSIRLWLDRRFFREELSREQMLGLVDDLDG